MKPPFVNLKWLRVDTCQLATVVLFMRIAKNHGLAVGLECRAAGSAWDPKGVPCLNPVGLDWLMAGKGRQTVSKLHLSWLEFQKPFMMNLLTYDESCDLTCTTPGTMSLGPSWCRTRTLKNILNWSYFLAFYLQTRVHMTYCKCSKYYK